MAITATSQDIEDVGWDAPLPSIKRGTRPTVSRTLNALVVWWLIVPAASAIAAPMWSVDGASDEETDIFGEVKDILRLADGRTAILDAQLGHVRILDQSGAHEQTIACDGDGPGEVRNAVALVEFPPGRLSVVQARPPKLAMLGMDGATADDWVPEFVGNNTGLMVMDAASGGGMLVMQTYSVVRSEHGYTENAQLIRWASPQLTPTVLLVRDDQSDASGNIAREAGPLDDLTIWDVDAQGRLLVSEDFDRFVVRVISTTGSTPREDRRPDFKRVERAPERYDSIRAQYEAMAKYAPRVTGVDVSRFERVIQNVYAASDGGYYVLSSRSVFHDDQKHSLTLSRWTRGGLPSGEVSIDVGVRQACDMYWISNDYCYVVRGGKSAFRAARRGSAMAEDILGEDPCADTDGSADMTIECYPLAPGIAGESGSSRN